MPELAGNMTEQIFSCAIDASMAGIYVCHIYMFLNISIVFAPSILGKHHDTQKKKNT